MSETRQATISSTKEEFVQLMKESVKTKDPLKIAGHVRIRFSDVGQQITPETVRDMVIPVMEEMEELSDLPVSDLYEVPLGLLRRDNIRCMGKCRFHRESFRERKFWPEEPRIEPKDVRRIDLCRTMLTPEWIRVAISVLFHEYLHALGFGGHTPMFRSLEALWPDEDANGGYPRIEETHEHRMEFYRS
tara:strand:+ start:633 stop:1199 length:567 start_codon:yes stop_codon:yes gene_type:complete